MERPVHRRAAGHDEGRAECRPPCRHGTPLPQGAHDQRQPHSGQDDGDESSSASATEYIIGAARGAPSPSERAQARPPAGRGETALRPPQVRQVGAGSVGARSSSGFHDHGQTAGDTERGGRPWQNARRSFHPQPESWEEGSERDDGLVRGSKRSGFRQGSDRRWVMNGDPMITPPPLIPVPSMDAVAAVVRANICVGG